MRAHRFYSQNLQPEHTYWLHDDRLLAQWTRVLRFTPGQEVILFDGKGFEGLFKINELAKDGAKISLVTEYALRLPTRKVYLFWSVLKNDHNDLVIEKATELGVTHFIPVIAERCVKVGFNGERAERIAIEASEQCGRSDVPVISEPVQLQEALGTYADQCALFAACMGAAPLAGFDLPESLGICIGPEGGWTDHELELFNAKAVQRVGLTEFTLRAETAAITAAALVGRLQ